MQTNYNSVSAERERRYDNWQHAATVMKREIMALYNSGVLPMDRVTELFDQHPKLRGA
jgi:hypothetical protein